MLDERNDMDGMAGSAHVGAGWREIDRQVRRIARRRAALDAEEARLLVAAQRAEVHVRLGYGSMIEYLERACGLARRTAWERLRVAEALDGLPGMMDALAGGMVSYSAVKELTRVATSDTEGEWLAAVETCTVREIEDLVRGHQVGDRPDDRPDPAIETRTVKLELTPEAYALWREARVAMEREAGESLEDADVMVMVCRRALSARGAERKREGVASNQPAHVIAMTPYADGERERAASNQPAHVIAMTPYADGKRERVASNQPPHVIAMTSCADGKRERAASNQPAYVIAMTPCADGKRERAASNRPAYVIAMTQCRDCKRAWQETGRASIEVPAAVIDRARCDALELGDVDGSMPVAARRTIPAPVRRAVLARDRHRCVVPGCGSSEHVDLHHLVPRAQGGAHVMANLVCLCWRHHASAHVGTIVIRGVPGALEVRHADGRRYGAPPG